MASGQQVASLYAKIGADTADLKRGLRDAETAMGRTASQFGASANLISAAFRSPAFVIAGLGVAAVAAMGDMTRSSMNLSRQLAEVKAVTQGTAAEMDKLRDTAKTVGPQFGMMASDVAAGMVDLAKAGLTAEQIAGGGAKAIATLASAGGVSMGEAAEIGATAMAVWNKKASDMAKIADVVAGAANASVIGVNDFRLSLAMAGAVSAMANQSFESTATAIAILGKNGIKNSDAGTSLKQMMLNLVPSSDKAAEAMKRLGIITGDGSNKFFDAEGKAKSYAQIAQVLQESLAGLTQAERLKNLEVIFGSDAIRSATILAKEGSVGFDQMAASIAKVSAAEVAAQKLDSASGAMQKAKAEAGALGDAIGNRLEPAIKAAANAAADSLRGWNILISGANGAGGALRYAGDQASYATGHIQNVDKAARNAALALYDLRAAHGNGEENNIYKTDVQRLKEMERATRDAIQLAGEKATYNNELRLAVDARDVKDARETIADVQKSYEERIEREQKAAGSAAESAASKAQAAWNKAMEGARDGVNRLKAALADLANRRVAGSQAFDDRAFSLEQQIAAQELKISGMRRKGIRGSALRTEEKKLDALNAQRGDLGNQRTLALGGAERAVDMAMNPRGAEMSAADLVDLITRTRGAMQTAENAVNVADMTNNVTVNVTNPNASPEEIAAAVVEAIGGSVASFEVGAKPTLAGARR